jgi:hypothetical protein
MANTRKRKQKQTLREFRAWLQGVEELQAENWAPNRDQWKLIRDKIDGIIEEKRTVEKVINNVVQGQTLPQATQPPVPAALPFIPPPPIGGIPLSDIDMTPAARAMLNPGDGKIKTPDIDTSDGHITSPFV